MYINYANAVNKLRDILDQCETLYDVLYKYTVGDTITIKYYRDGKIHDATVKLSKAVGEI